MTTHLHGVPLQEWVGRQVKLDSRDAPGDARKPATIKAFNPKAGTAKVQPGGHKGNVEIPLDKILPWWSRNDDLRRKYGIQEDGTEPRFMFMQLPLERFFGRMLKAFLPDQGVAYVLLDGPSPAGVFVTNRKGVQWEIGIEALLPNWPDNRDLQQESIAASRGENINSLGKAFETAFKPVASTHNHHEPILPTSPETKPESFQGNETEESTTNRPVGTLVGTSRTEVDHESSQKGPPGRKEQAMTTPLRSIKRILVDPKASSTWMEDYKALEDALRGVGEAEKDLAAAEHHLAVSRSLVDTYIGALDGVGVQIEWDEPEEPAAPVVSVISGLSELDANRVKSFRATLIKQMNPGRKYTKQALLQILNEQDNATTKKILQHTFKNHPTLKRKLGGPGTETTYSIIS